MPKTTQFYINILIIIVISITSIYLSINNENSIIHSIIDIYNKNDNYGNHNINNEYSNDRDEITNINNNIISADDIKKSSIFKNYPNRFKHLEKREQLVQQQIQNEKEEKLKEILQENERIEKKNKIVYYKLLFIAISFIGLIITIIGIIIRNKNKEDNKIIDGINNHIKSIDDNINSIISYKPLIEVNKMKSIKDPFILEELLSDFKHSYNNNNINNNSNNPVLLEFKKEIDILDKKQEINLNKMTDIIQTISIYGNNNKKLLEENEVFQNNDDYEENSSGSSSSSNNNNYYNNVDKNLKRLSFEVQAKMFMYQYKKWDKQKEKSLSEVERIKKENEKEFKENEKRKQEQEIKKREYLESIEEIRESKFFLLSIKVIVILNILPELIKLLFYHLNSIIPTIICFNSNTSNSSSGIYNNLSLKLFKSILNNTPFLNLVECIPIGFKINYNLIFMTIAYIGILIFSLTLHSNAYIITLPLLAITFYTYKIDYSNLNSYLIHLAVNLLLLLIWKLFIHKYQTTLITKYHKWFISPSILLRIVIISIIVAYNIIIHKYLLESINLIITK